MTDIVAAARELADALTECLDDGQRIGYLDVLDALGICRLTLAEGTKEASSAYVESVELEKAWAES